jgi:hypothetical protein
MNATTTRADDMIATNAKLNRMALELTDLSDRRAALRAEMNATPDGQSVLDRETAIMTVTRQIDRLSVAYGAEMLHAKLG